MGTRADFYVGRGPDATWLGSIAWDGYPDGVLEYSEKHTEEDGTKVTRDLPMHKVPMATAKTPEEFMAAVNEFFETRQDVTLPEHGWPWPWDDSGTTDFAYTHDEGELWVSCYGSPWYRPHKGEDVVDEETGESNRPGSREKTEIYRLQSQLGTGWRDSRENYPELDDEARAALEAELAEAEAAYQALSPAVFPDMTDIQNVARGHRSGTMMIGIDETGKMTIE